MKFKTPYRTNEFPDNGEVNNEPSLTRPDESMSVQEILNRVQRGLPVTGIRQPEFDDEDADDFYAIPNFDKMDLAEKEELLRLTTLRIEELKAEMNKKAAEKREADRQAALEKQLQEFEAMEKLREEKDRFKPRKKDTGVNDDASEREA